MRFLFVDRITEVGDGVIAGLKHFDVGAPMQYGDGRGERQIAPGVVSEAIGQLVSWLCIKNNDFSRRPVFLFADKIGIAGIVRPGDTVDLKARIDSMEKDGETFVFSGEASVQDRLVATIENCSGYFMPLGDLEDPEVTKQRYGALINGGLKLDGDHDFYDFDQLLGEVVEQTGDAAGAAGSGIVARKTMAPSERFFADHFPRFPVTPIVVINEMIGAVTAKLASPHEPRALMPRAVEQIKIRNFVKPGETVETKVKITGRHPGKNGRDVITTMAEVTKGGKTILRGRYVYEL
jgi:3-hydroxymyristoyl/3-hydroxydecanoyl-(acyl carrier protein) dehydratase